jgi:hypothetical protein
MNLLDNIFTDVIKHCPRQRGHVYVKIEVKLSLCLVNLAPHYEDGWESGGITP